MNDLNRLIQTENLFELAITVNEPRQLHLLHLVCQWTETNTLLCDLRHIETNAIRRLVRKLRQKVEYLERKINEVEEEIALEDAMVRLNIR